MDRLSLSDVTARTRIGESVNERYAWLCDSMGLQTAVQDVASAQTVVGSNALTFGPQPLKVVKINTIRNPAYPKPNNLGEVSLDTLRLMLTVSDPAQNYAIYQMGADRVTVLLDSTPATIYQLDADVIADKATLSGADVPTFAAGYHNILYYGAMATEYDKQEKAIDSGKFEAKFEIRCSELRMFIAKSILKDIYQGKNSPGPVLVNRLV